MVKRYARLMSELSFPAVLVTKDAHIIDGNTRTRAHGERNERYIKAWVLPIAWEGATPETKEKLLLLSLALNSMNGLPLDEGELLNYAGTLIRGGASDEEAMGRTGLPITKITALRDKQRATDRLHHVGISDTELVRRFPNLHCGPSARRMRCGSMTICSRACST